MTRTPLPHRRRIAAAALAVGLPLVAGCGFDAQTNQVYQPAVGANERTQDVNVLGAVVVAAKEGQGVFVATLVNTADAGDDRLTAIAGPDGITVSGVKPITLPSQEPVNLEDAGITVSGKAIDTVTSNYVLLSLTFDDGGVVRVNVPVVPATGPYAGIGAPSAPATPNDVASAGAEGVDGDTDAGE